MPVTQGQVQLIEQLYGDGISVSEISRTVGISYNTVRNYTTLKARGFKSRTDYENWLARQHGYQSEHDRKRHSIRARGFESFGAYFRYLSARRGFGSYAEFEEYMQDQNQAKSQNELFAVYVLGRLAELGKTVGWLAGQIGISRTVMGRYARGRNLPSQERREKILEVLGKHQLPPLKKNGHRRVRPILLPVGFATNL